MTAADLGVSTPTVTKHVLPDGVTVIVRDGAVSNYTVPDSDHHTRLALGRCARLRYRHADAQRTYARLLQGLCLDVLSDPRATPPASAVGDVEIVLAGMAEDAARKQDVADRVRAFVARLGESA